MKKKELLKIFKEINTFPEFNVQDYISKKTLMKLIINQFIYLRDFEKTKSGLLSNIESGTYKIPCFIKDI